MTRRSLLRGLLTDITPLRFSADYRRLWFGLSVGQLGQQMTAVAVAIQVFDLTRSSFAVGVVGLCALVPLVTFGLYGGAVADAVDRRKLGLLSSTALWLLSISLAVQAFVGVGSVALLYGIVALQAACFAVNNPARSAIIPRLLPAHLLPSANALSTASFNLGYTVGPLLGGVIYGAAGPGAAYTVDCVTFTAALYSLFRLPPVPPLGDVRRAGLASVLEGLRYLRTRPNVLMTFLVDMCAMVFAQPRALFPAIAGSFYGGGKSTIGLLSAAPAIGALAAVSLSGWTGRIRRQGRAVIIAVVAYGATIAALGATRLLWVGVLFLALSGAADMISSVYRNTILQVATPDELRGRLQGVFIVVVAGGPRLGDFTAGSLAALTSETAAIVAGGTLCMAGAVALAARYRGFLRYDARSPQP